MNILFRVDSSLVMGSGHLMRCLALAKALRQHGYNVEFISRWLDGNLIYLCENESIRTHILPAPSSSVLLKDDSIYAKWLGVDWRTDAKECLLYISELNKPLDWVIVDHYALDIHWEKTLRPVTHKIMVIDDLANRRHDCDLLLDQNFHTDMQVRYNDLVFNSCEMLLGPHYALLRPEFSELHESVMARKGIVKRIFVFFGGSDQANFTSKVLQELQVLQSELEQVDVVVGSSNPHKDLIQQWCCNRHKFVYYCQTHQMAELMKAADLAIGAGGSANWERCCLGLPAIVVTIAGNQEELSKKLDQYGVIEWLGSSTNVTGEDILHSVIQLMRAPDKLANMSRRGLELVDGLGVKRVLIRLLEVFEHL